MTHAPPAGQTPYVPPHTHLIPSLRKCNQTKKVGFLFFRTYIWKFKRGSWLFHTPAGEITDRQRAVNPAAGRLDKTPKSSPVPRVPSIIHNVIHEQSSQRTHARPRASGPPLTGAAHELIPARGARPRLDSVQARILESTEVEGCILFLGGF